MLNLNTTFYFKRSDPHNYKIPFHSHKCYELVYYLSGSGHSRINNKKYDYAENYCVLIPPEYSHNDVHKTNCTLICIGFTIEDHNFPILQGSFPDENGKIRTTLLEIHKEFKEQKSDFMEIINNLLKNILLKIKRISGIQLERISNHENSLSRALNYINEYFLTDITNEQLAKISQYSYDRFRHIFKNEIGISPSQYIFNKRLEHSKTLLSSTTLSITEIAFDCGFSSTSHYIQAFKKNMNITPSQYRKQLHSEHVFSPEQTNYKK